MQQRRFSFTRLAQDQERFAVIADNIGKRKMLLGRVRKRKVVASDHWVGIKKEFLRFDFNTKKLRNAETPNYK